MNWLRNSLAITVSLILHGALLYFGGRLLFEKPEVAMTSGESNVEVELVASPADLSPEDSPLSTPAIPEIPLKIQAPIEPPPEPVVEETVEEKIEEKVEVPEPPIPTNPPPAQVVEKVVEPVKLSPSEIQSAPVKTAQANSSQEKKSSTNAKLRDKNGTGDGSSSRPGNDVTTAGRSGVEVVAQPDYLRNPPPVYPEISRRAKEEGTVWLNTQVDSKGRAIQVEIAKSSGYSRLDQAAREAVRRWRFKPARTGGVAVESSVQIPVTFRLK